MIVGIQAFVLAEPEVRLDNIQVADESVAVLGRDLPTISVRIASKATKITSK
jgi:hypothetical protein